MTQTLVKSISLALFVAAVSGTIGCGSSTANGGGPAVMAKKFPGQGAAKQGAPDAPPSTKQ